MHRTSASLALLNSPDHDGKKPEGVVSSSWNIQEGSSGPGNGSTGRPRRLLVPMRV